jgi:hypothetical protein
MRVEVLLIDLCCLSHPALCAEEVDDRKKHQNANIVASLSILWVWQAISAHANATMMMRYWI